MVDDFVFDNTVPGTTKKWFSVSKPTVRICAAAADTFMTLKTVLFEWNKLFAADRGYNHCPRKKRNNFILSICFGRCFFPEIRKFYLTTYLPFDSSNGDISCRMEIETMESAKHLCTAISEASRKFLMHLLKQWRNSTTGILFFAMADWDDRVFTRDRKISRRMLQYKWS